LKNQQPLLPPIRSLKSKLFRLLSPVFGICAICGMMAIKCAGNKCKKQQKYEPIEADILKTSPTNSPTNDCPVAFPVSPQAQAHGHQHGGKPCTGHGGKIASNGGHATPMSASASSHGHAHGPSLSVEAANIKKYKETSTFLRNAYLSWQFKLKFCIPETWEFTWPRFIVTWLSFIMTFGIVLFEYYIKPVTNKQQAKMKNQTLIVFICICL
jgi:hypothetical protein